MSLTIEKRNSIIKDLKRRKKSRISFESITLKLTKDTLVPHPDTANLINDAIRIVKVHKTIDSMADVGTGSGIIAIKLALHFPNKIIYASDISKNALKIAKNNSRDNKINNIIFLHNTDGVFLSEFKKKKIDLIVSNPPFVDDIEFMSTEFRKLYPEVQLEPELAIRTFDKSGFKPYLDILKNSSKNKTKLFLFQCNNLNIDRLSIRIQKTFKCRVRKMKNSKGVNKYLFVNKN